MAISLCSNDYQNQILKDNRNKTISYLGVGDFEIHTLNSLKMFSKSLPHMIYPTLIKKLKNSGEKSVKINFVSRPFAEVNDIIDFQLYYGDFIMNY